MEKSVKPYPGSNATIEKIAEVMRQSILANGQMVSNSTFLREVVARTGGKVQTAYDPTEQEAEGGSLVIRDEGDYTIFLSPYTFSLRDNFTIAHEVGHYVLHYYPQKNELELPLWFTRYGTGPVEWQANRFAAALLMPERNFREKHKELEGNLSLLSGMFNVSESAVAVRAKSLCLAD